MIANGGAPDLGYAVLHDGHNASVKGGLNDGGNVLEVNGPVVVSIALSGSLNGARLCARCGRRMR